MNGGEPRRPARMLVVVAHPDDETFGLGSVIAGAAARGAEVVVCCATRGEAGESAVPLTAGQQLADVRDTEFREAGRLLGVSSQRLLGFVDSGMSGPAGPDTLAGAPMEQVVERVLAVVDEVRPTVVVTLDTVTSDGHRDHDRIAAATVAATAQRPRIITYLWCVPRPTLQAWFSALQSARPDAEYLQEVPTELGRPMSEVTTVLDSRPYAAVRRLATAAHRSQRPPFDGMPGDLVDSFINTDHLVRVQPPWTGGPQERSLPL